MAPTPTLIRDTLVDPAPGTLITPSFPFLDAAHLHFWDEDDTEITEKFDPTTPGSFFPKEAITGTVILSRYTPREEVYRVFSDGSSISSARFNEVFTWVLYVLQEIAGGSNLDGPTLRQLLLPDFPAPGDRDGKVVEFKGDILRWVEAESSSIRFTDEEIGRLAFRNAPDPGDLTPQQKQAVSRATDIGVRWRGEWTANFSYETGDLVTHVLGGGATRGFYYALSSNIASPGNQPGISSTATWYLLAVSNGALDSVTGVTRSGDNLVFTRRGGGTPITVTVPAQQITKAAVYALVKQILIEGRGIDLRDIPEASEIQVIAEQSTTVPTAAELFSRFEAIIQAGEGVTIDADRNDHTLTLNAEGGSGGAEGFPIPQVLTVGSLGTFTVNSGASREIPVTAVSEGNDGYVTKTAGSNNTVTVSKVSTVRVFATATVRKASGPGTGRVLPMLTPTGTNVSLLSQSSPYIRTSSNTTDTYTVSLSATFVVAADGIPVGFSITNREIEQDSPLVVTAITRMGILPELGPKGSKGDKGDPGEGAQDFVESSELLEAYTYNTSFGITKGQIHVGEASGILRFSIALKDGDTLGSKYLEPGTFITYRGDIRWQVKRLISNTPPTITFEVRDLGNDPGVFATLANTAHSLVFSTGILPRTLTLENRVDVVEDMHFNPIAANFARVIKAGEGIDIAQDDEEDTLTFSTTDDVASSAQVQANTRAVTRLQEDTADIERTIDSSTRALVAAAVGGFTDVFDSTSRFYTSEPGAISSLTTEELATLQNARTVWQQDGSIRPQHAVVVRLAKLAGAAQAPKTTRAPEGFVITTQTGGTERIWSYYQVGEDDDWTYYVPHRDTERRASENGRLEELQVRAHTTFHGQLAGGALGSIDNRLETFEGAASWLWSDGTTEPIHVFHPTAVDRIVGPTTGPTIVSTALRPDVPVLLKGFIPRLTSVSQITAVRIGGLLARGSTALEKGEFLGGRVTGTDGAPGHFALKCVLRNGNWHDIKNNGASSGEVGFQIFYNYDSLPWLWTLRVPYLTTTEATAAPVTPYIPIESVKRGIDIDQVKQTFGTAQVVGRNHEISTRLQLNSENTKAALGKIVIPLAEATVADNAITTAKLADNAVTAAKLADNAVIAARLANEAVTPAKLAPATVTALTTIKVARLPTTSINENATYFQMGNGVAGTAAPGLYVRHSGAWVVVSRRKVRIGTFSKTAALADTYESTGITLPAMDDDDCVLLDYSSTRWSAPLQYCVPWHRFNALTRVAESSSLSASNSILVSEVSDDHPTILYALTTAGLLLIGTANTGITNANLIVSRS